MCPVYANLLEKSLEWIRLHPRAYNTDVPESLSSSWIMPSEESEEPDGYFFQVFAFGFMQRKLYSSPRSRKNPHKVSLSKLQECFMVWQLKLAMSELSQKTDLKSEPMELWAFPANEQVRFWGESST